MLKQFWSVICSFVILSGCYIPEEVPESRMNGYVGFSYPVVGGHVRIWELHPIDGSMVHSDPIAEAITDENGEFDIDMTGLGGTLLVTVHGGTTREYWDLADKAIGMTIHSTAIIPNWHAGKQTPVTITPWTTLAEMLGTVRLQSSTKQEAFFSIVKAANHQIYEHAVRPLFHENLIDGICELDLTCIRPLQFDNLKDQFDLLGSEHESILFTVSLISFSAVSRARYSRAHSTHDIRGARTRQALDDLIIDLMDNGLFDGNRSVGTTDDTLRSQFSYDAVDEFWDTDFNQTGIAVDDLVDYFCRIANESNPALFGRMPREAKSLDCGP